MRGLKQPFRNASLQRTYYANTMGAKMIKVPGMLVENQIMTKIAPVVPVSQDSPFEQPEDCDEDNLQAQPHGEWIFRDHNEVWC